MLNPAEYEAIWRQVCECYALKFDASVFKHTMALYHKENRPLLPCHPLDLLSLVMDQCRYEGVSNNINNEYLDNAWNSYFVRPLTSPAFSVPSAQEHHRLNE